MNKVEISFTPALFNLYDYQESIVVVIDVLRATTAICAAIDHEMESVIPVATVAEALEYKDEPNYMLAAERDGKVVKGFQLGNSPLSYIGEDVKDKTLILTTTNGTKAIDRARKAYKVAVASFINLDAISNWLIEQDRDVMVFCSGWKDKFNLEDTICGGAIAKQLLASKKFETECDSTLGAIHLFNTAENDLFGFLKESSHRRRLGHMHLEEDIAYCLSYNNKTDVIPVLSGHKLVDV